MPGNHIANMLISDEVAHALHENLPIVALESTVITHGLPYPDNLRIANDMEAIIRSQNCVPATIAVLDGEPRIGLDSGVINRLVAGKDLHKISTRDLGVAVSLKWSGGTTVAGTIYVAKHAGIQVFATGGIGGIHRGDHLDISADLPQLASTPLVVVCAGAKAILDLPSTLEVLETLSVPVIGYRTGEFPAFFSQHSGLTVQTRVDSAKEVASLAKAHWDLGFCSSVLVCNPLPSEVAIPFHVMDQQIGQALKKASDLGIRGQDVTPFLLQCVNQLTEGASLKANLALLRSNARLAAQIALELAKL